MVEAHIYPFCAEVKECGHQCRGVLGEAQCLPCMDQGCNNEDGMEVDQSAACGICKLTELGAKPCVGLECGHVFHADCIHKRIEKRETRRITLSHLHCPTCKEDIALDSTQAPLNLIDMLRSKM